MEVSKKIHFGFKKKESCGLRDFLITSLSIVSTSKRIKDMKCCIHNISLWNSFVLEIEWLNKITISNV